MVVGLDIFKEWFAEHTDAFVLIGGTAATLCMGEQALDFRATKDLDIVLMVEVLEPRFFEVFWRFIDEGGYTIQERSPGLPILYRFTKPGNVAFPAQIELFSQAPEDVHVPSGRTLTRIPAGDGLTSLSAILLDPTYYAYIAETRTTIEGLPVTPVQALIPLKASAYLDLRRRKAEGEGVDEKNVKKHKNDVFRLSRLLAAESHQQVPAAILQDIEAFLAAMRDDPPALKDLGIDVPLVEAVQRIRSAFSLR